MRWLGTLIRPRLIQNDESSLPVAHESRWEELYLHTLILECIIVSRNNMAVSKRHASVTSWTVLVPAVSTMVSLLLWRRRQRWTSTEERARRREFQQETKEALFHHGNPQMVSVDDSGTTQLLTTHYRPDQPNPNNGITAVLIHGFGCTSIEFDLLQERLREETTMDAFAYDRILFTESSQQDRLPSPRNAKRLAAELRHLLQQRNIKPPYLLIGHSYGGIIAQQYCADFSTQDVCGVVLVDPAHEWQMQTFPTDFALGFKYMVPFLLHVYSKVAWTGVLRLMDAVGAFNFPPIFLFGNDRQAHRSACAHLYSDGVVWQRVKDELVGCFATFLRLQQPPYATFRQHSWGKVPVALVVAGQRQFSPTLFRTATTQAFIDMHRTVLQDNPESSQLFVAQKSDHWIHMQEPEVILEAIRFVTDRMTA